MKLSIEEVRFLIKLLSQDPDADGWYNIKSTKLEVRANTMSARCSKLVKEKKILEKKEGNNFYRLTETGKKALEEFDSQIVRPFTKIVYERFSDPLS